MATRTTTKKTDTAQSVAEKAYERFLSRGGEHGYDMEDWLAAESEVNGTRPKRVVSKPRTTKAKVATTKK
jgi:Protein of unknown function (DUF2934)